MGVHGQNAGPAWRSILEPVNSEPTHNPYVILNTKLNALHPNSQHLTIRAAAFPLDDFLVETQKVTKETLYLPDCTSFYSWELRDLSPEERKESAFQESLSGIEPELKWHVRDGVMQFTYEGADFLAYKSFWMNNSWSNPTSSFLHLVWDGPDQTTGKELASAVFKHTSKSEDAIWVYHNGAWSKDKGLFAAVQDARWEDLVLDKGFTEKLKRDTETFFANRNVYRALNVAWKRGILLIGQPGLGKTETIKLLLKDSRKPALYVKSFNTEQGAEEGIRAIFEQARARAPCILVLEDLDSMIKSNIRSFFLNELDGLEKNDGILTIATTNHAEKIDDSILNRPSRFDTKYFFNYPHYKLRVAYCQKWLQKVHEVGKLDLEDPKLLAERVADKTDGWSFAFLKELFVSFLLTKASQESRGEESKKDVRESLMDQVEQLSEQVQNGLKAVGDAEVDGGSGPWVRPSASVLVKSQANMYV